MRRTVLSITLAALCACGDDAKAGPTTASAELTALPYPDNPSPGIQGSVNMKRDGGTTTVRVSVSGCPEGRHALHVHEGTSCGEDGSAAGAHWNPPHAEAANATIRKHGGEDVDIGALGVVICEADGTGTLTFVTEEWELGEGNALDPAGRVILLHGLEATQRVACGRIELD